MAEKKRRINNFEKFLLVIGFAVIIGGFFLINKVFAYEPRLSYPLLEVCFLWLILIFMLILTDSNESIKEEMREVLESHIKEVRLMQQIAHEEIEELKLLRGNRATK